MSEAFQGGDLSAFAFVDGEFTYTMRNDLGRRYVAGNLNWKRIAVWKWREVGGVLLCFVLVGFMGEKFLKEGERKGEPGYMVGGGRLKKWEYLPKESRPGEENFQNRGNYY